MYVASSRKSNLFLKIRMLAQTPRTSNVKDNNCSKFKLVRWFCLLDRIIYDDSVYIALPLMGKG